MYYKLCLGGKYMADKEEIKTLEELEEKGRILRGVQRKIPADVPRN